MYITKNNLLIVINHFLIFQIQMDVMNFDINLGVKNFFLKFLDFLYNNKQKTLAVRNLKFASYWA